MKAGETYFMKSIKYKILINFCLTALVTIGIVSIIVSWQLDKGLSHQTEKLAADMTTQIYETLNLPHQTFELLIQKDIRRSVHELRTSSMLIANLGSGQLKALEAELHTIAMDRKLDFAMVLNLHGYVEASFPADIHEIEIERYVTSWEFGTHLLRALEDETTETSEVWDTFRRRSKFSD
jgi:hypothetical protein